MRKSTILTALILGLFTYTFAEVLATFPEMVKPVELRIDNQYIYISDQYSVFVYDRNTMKKIIRIGQKGEGPLEFKHYPQIIPGENKLILSDISKVMVFSNDLKYIEEFQLHNYRGRLTFVDGNMVSKTNRDIGKTEYYVFTLYNWKQEKIKDLTQIPIPTNSREYFITPWAKSRSWKGKIYISRPEKGFIFEVFDKAGKKLFEIDKNREVPEVKSQEKHRQRLMDKLRYYVGRRRYEKARLRGAYDRKIPEYLPGILNFWVLEDKIFAKTYDMKDKKDKFIIMDLKGKILKTIFLPRVYMEIQTFHGTGFYYLALNEDEEEWELRRVDY
jgi:hypothetical protein